MKNGGKKNETDWIVTTTVQCVSVGSSNNVCVENILLEDQNSRTAH